MASSSGQGSSHVGSTSSDVVVRVVPTKRNRDVWQHYDMCEMASGEKKARCKYCNGFYSKDANSSLKTHVSKPFCKVLKEQARTGQPSMTSEGNIFAYNIEAVREEMACFVIQESLPFNHFDNQRYTRLVQRTLQPRYTHVSRATLRRDCLKMWKKAKNETISFFENLQTGVNLTSDVWSTPHGVPDSYICVTAHWIQPDSWQMMKRTLAFQLFDYPHTGENIYKFIDKVIQTYKLEEKIFSISFDNASNNNVAVTQLKLKYDPMCDGVFFHSRCVAHIINLAVQDGLRVIESQKEGFKRMLRDIFSNVQRYTKYIKFCKDANKPCYAPNWDMPTRWSSTCTMFEKAILQKETIIAFHQILSSRGKVNAYHPRNWETIEVVSQMLQVFKTSTTAISGVYYPTSPITIHKIFLMTSQLSKMSDRGSPYSDMVKPMKEKLKKYFSELPPVFTCAAALNPCYNLRGVESMIDRIVYELDLNCAEDPFFSQGLKNRFNNHLNAMYAFYQTKYGSTSQIHESMRTVLDEGSSDPDFTLYSHLWDLTTQQQATNTPSSEIGRYSGSNFLQHVSPQQFKNFDLLAWWKEKEEQFPILAAMARDLLSVQASTVASESTFSTSGRVLSIRRTRLTPKAVEMSICLKDYLDAANRVQDKRSLEGELQYEAELYEDEVNGNLIEPMTDEEAELDEFIRNNSNSGED